MYTGQSAAAPELRYEFAAEDREAPVPVPAAVERPAARNRPRAVAYQPSLFSFQEVPRPVQLQSLPPEQSREVKEHPRTAPRTRARRTIPGQQTLEFATFETQALKSTGMSAPQTAIYCDAPVAIAAHRLIAAALDMAIVGIAVGIFTAIFYATVLRVAGGELQLDRQTLPLLAGIAVVFGLLYNTLWALANADSAGMRWARLRLLNFDGNVPDRDQRLYRLACECLSLMAAGLGLIWALVDEESLTWHDHISKTFPTPY